MSPLDNILRERTLLTHFQAIVSVKKLAVVALEALSRGPADKNGALIEPTQLFHAAAEEGRSDELDSLCREQALQQFSAIAVRPKGLMLFINVEADQLGSGRFSASSLQRQAQGYGLRAQDIALELSARPAQRTPGLRSIIETLQAFGFTVALEDVSASAADLALLALLKPNIVKADQGLLNGIERDPVRQELLRSLFSLGHRLGALGVAEAVENEEQSALSLELGADLLQGHLYSRAVAPAQLALPQVQAGVDRSAARYKASLASKVQGRQRESQRQSEILDKLLKALGEAPLSGLEAVLSSYVNAIASLECLYALDAHGRQVSSTVTWQHQRSGATASLFAPATAGTDHSLKDYFLGVQASELGRFVSEPYVSLATGNLCRTLAARFKSSDGQEAIVCVDIKSQ